MMSIPSIDERDGPGFYAPYVTTDHGFDQRFRRCPQRHVASGVHHARISARGASNDSSLLHVRRAPEAASVVELAVYL